MKVYKEPENPLIIIRRNLRSIFGKKTAKDKIKDHMYNTNRK